MNSRADSHPGTAHLTALDVCRKDWLGAGRGPPNAPQGRRFRGDTRRPPVPAPEHVDNRPVEGKSPRQRLPPRVQGEAGLSPAPPPRPPSSEGASPMPAPRPQPRVLGGEAGAARSARPAVSPGSGPQTQGERGRARGRPSGWAGLGRPGADALAAGRGRA